MTKFDVIVKNRLYTDFIYRLNNIVDQTKKESLYES